MLGLSSLSPADMYYEYDDYFKLHTSFTWCNYKLTLSSHYLSVGSKFHASKLRQEQVSAYRQYEREKVEKHLDEYIHQCSKMKV